MKTHERIPLHDHSDRNSGGPLDPAAKGGAGTSTGGSGGGSVSLALGDLTNVDTTGAVAGAILVFDGTFWRPGYGAVPLILEDGTVAILEDGSAAMGETTYS